MTPAELDDLPDNVLVMLKHTLQISSAPDRKNQLRHLDRVHDRLQAMDDIELTVLEIEVKDAFDRRFGEVPGY